MCMGHLCGTIALSYLCQSNKTRPRVLREEGIGFGAEYMYF